MRRVARAWGVIAEDDNVVCFAVNECCRFLGYCALLCRTGWRGRGARRGAARPAPNPYISRPQDAEDARLCRDVCLHRLRRIASVDDPLFHDVTLTTKSDL